MTLKIDLGALSPPLSWQLTKQNSPFDKEKVEHFQKDLDAISRLRVRGILMPGDAEKAEKRLFKKVQQHILGMNKSVTQ